MIQHLYAVPLFLINLKYPGSMLKEKLEHAVPVAYLAKINHKKQMKIV